MKLPGIVLAEQLLASANMSAEHQLLLTNLQGNITFDRVADELVAQRSKLHERERSRNFVPKKPCYGYQQNRKRSGKWHGVHSMPMRLWSATSPTPRIFMKSSMRMKSPMPLRSWTQEEEEDGIDLDVPDSAEAAAEVLQAKQEAFFVKRVLCRRARVSVDLLLHPGTLQSPEASAWKSARPRSPP